MTPVIWGEFAIKKFRIFDKWLHGATIFDPTMGTANLLESLVEYGIKKGYSLSALPICQLYGNELNSEYYRESLYKFSFQYGVDMSNNFWNRDILELQPLKYSFGILFGNPPWMNFSDLPQHYKESIKSKFFEYHLVENSQKLLLGGARIDIAGLVIQKTIKDFLKEKGDAFFYIPLSLLLNDGANNYFRKYKVHNIQYSLKKVYDFNKINAFDNISTRYGLVHFQRDSKTIFPITYEMHDTDKWKKLLAKPLFYFTNPLSVFQANTIHSFKNFQHIILNKESTPRQGVNSCGANSILYFHSYETISKNYCRVNGNIELPSKFVFPLLTSMNFKRNTLSPNRWVLLPYNKNGKPLELKQLEKYPPLKKYLLSHKEKLQKRKGIMIGSWLKRGFWWALLGVGEYNFYPYKIVWEAYGKKTFRPKIFTENWQASQSLQVYIPVKTEKETKRIYSELQNPAIESYLLSIKMEGTMNWAQPGRIKKLIQFNSGK